MGSADAPCSATWRVWTSRDEAYIAPRVMGGVAKLSLHSSGKWHLEVEHMRPSWQRPEPARPGWVRGPTVMIPHNDNAGHPAYIDPHDQSKIRWLPQPKPGMLAQVAALFYDPSKARDQWRPSMRSGTAGLTVLRLQGGRELHLVRADRPLREDEIAHIAEIKAASLVHSVAHGHSTFVVLTDQAKRPALFEVQLGGHRA